MALCFLDCSDSKEKWRKPKSCNECSNSYIEDLCPDECFQQYDKCPVRIIESPHGALVDINEVKNKMLKYGFKAPDMTVTEFIEDELTIILEAEVSEN